MLSACSEQSGLAGDEENVSKASQPITDEEFEALIQAKIDKIGGAHSTVRGPTTFGTLDNTMRYEIFSDVTIVATEDFGAVSMPQSFFDRWYDVGGTWQGVGPSGPFVYEYLGFPTADVAQNPLVATSRRKKRS
jgi:hypothetical protein